MTQPKNVRIFRAVKSAMQSGRAGAGRWVLEGETEGHRAPDSLMGWTGGTGTAGQVRLVFPGREQAVAFAEKKGWTYTVSPAQDRRISPRNYVDNFKYTPPEDGA